MYKPTDIRFTQEGGSIMDKKGTTVTCTIEMTEGAEKRLTEAFVDLYYGIKAGIYKGPSLIGNRTDKPA